MQPQTLNCPMCGAAVRSKTTKCQHCGVRLATVACPSCFAMMFLGAKHCSQCGAEAQRSELNDSADQSCPRCRVDMRSVLVGNTAMRECPRCDGLWVDTAAFEKICTDQEKQAAVLGVPRPAPALSPEAAGSIRYVPCPQCGKLMHRVNFANCSGVVVDVCKAHGTWFDRNELMCIVDFIRSGGLEKSRERRVAELAYAERRARLARQAAEAREFDWKSDVRVDGIRATGGLLRFLVSRG